MDEVARDVGNRVPKFRLGQPVVDYFGRRGVVHTVYANFASVLNSFTVPENWYEMQRPPPKTSKKGFWYAVVLDRGDVLVGEDDLKESLP